MNQIKDPTRTHSIHDMSVHTFAIGRMVDCGHSTDSKRTQQAVRRFMRQGYGWK